MIEIKNVSKLFGEFCAVDDLSFSIRPGEVVGFLGPNGAGKSTTMKMLTGFLPLTSGQITIDGLDVVEQPLAIKQKLGYLPEGAPAYGDMTPAQFLDFIAEVRGFSGEKKRQRIAKVVKDVELGAVLDKPIENLSKGFKRRVGLAQAIIHDPKVLVLDEPTDGLDPNQKHQVRQLISNISNDRIVIVSTHILEEVTAVCNRAIIIANGKKIFDATPLELQAKSEYFQAVTIEFTEKGVDTDVLLSLQGVERIESDGMKTTVLSQQGDNLYMDIYQLAEREQWPVSTIYAEQGRLDDIFRQLTNAA